MVCCIQTVQKCSDHVKTHLLQAFQLLGFGDFEGSQCLKSDERDRVSSGAFKASEWDSRKTQWRVCSACKLFAKWLNFSRVCVCKYLRCLEMVKFPQLHQYPSQNGQKSSLRALPWKTWETYTILARRHPYNFWINSTNMCLFIFGQDIV